MSTSTAVDFSQFPDAYAKTLSQVNDELYSSSDNIERSWRTTFWILSEEAERKSKWQFGDMIENIGLLVQDRAYWVELNKTLNPNLDYSIRLPDKALLWGINFFKQFLREIRKIICEKKKVRTRVEDQKDLPTASIAALSASLMTALHISNALATGLATLVLLTIATATKNAFCTMTDEEVLQKLEDASKTSVNFHEYLRHKKESK